MPAAVCRQEDGCQRSDLTPTTDLPHGFLTIRVKEYECHVQSQMQCAVMGPLEAGDTLDHYRLERMVARGGMATLFQATDMRDGRQVALKVPHAEMEADPVLVERFRREEEIGRELDHPGLVKTYDGEQRSRLYMVIEWVDGRLLRSILNEERRLPIERSTHFALEILDALDTMHKHGVVHRDLKPENIMVDAEDRIKLIDFGIAMKEDARRITFVDISSTLGTPDYIAPEQVKGQRGDQRSDIYSLGVMLYEMLVGEPPFCGPNPLAVMNERLLNDVEPVRERRAEVSPELEEILKRALEREPRNRYQTASEMEWELEHQEQVGVDEGKRRPVSGGVRLPAAQRMLLYAILALVPLAIFVLMVVLARR
jgi:eukaryotic-like serine/threonine-protein kinase